ncbi:DUF3159 domain-containing protein [Streptomyces sp. DW26H14]|uniref:DUF3159 domain-containing protein n=1 Tax=Streptomyces sp. DW26H14 TaxID=3435395 RepID=UPI00403D8B77
MTSLDKPAEPSPGSSSDDARAVTEAALFEAFGGVRGMVETVLPGLLFVTIYTINQSLKTSAVAALAVSLVLLAVRLVRRDTKKHAFSGVFGVAFGVAFAMFTGNAKGFYLPGLLYTLGLALAYLVTTLAGVPLIGVILGPIFKENLSWRTRNPGRRKAYTKSSWAWGLILLAKCAILFPLYVWGDATQLGWVLVSLKIPPFLLAVWLTWVFLAKAPAPIDVFAEMEAAEAADRAREEAAASPSGPPAPASGEALSSWETALSSEPEAGTASAKAPKTGPARHRRGA